jgi:hypothetical protein
MRVSCKNSLKPIQSKVLQVSPCNSHGLFSRLDIRIDSTNSYADGIIIPLEFDVLFFQGDFALQ